MIPIKISFGDGNTLIDITVKEEHQALTLDMLKEIWHDISEFERHDIEYINAEVCGELVVCCVTTAQGQGGIVFIWDTEQRKIVHYSNGKFAVKAAVHDNKVYVLREVSCWGVTAHLELDYCDLGAMSEDNSVTSIKLDEAVSSRLANSPDDYIIDFDGSTPVIKIKTANKMYKLIGRDGKPYYSESKGTLGGYRPSKIYGRLDCPSAKRYIAKGQYVKNRVFFADEETAVAAGYRPCAICMKEKYLLWKNSRNDTE